MSFPGDWCFIYNASTVCGVFMCHIHLCWNALQMCCFEMVAIKNTCKCMCTRTRIVD